MRFRAKKFIRDVSVTRVPLDSGGYDSTGAYWGVGSPLWQCQATLTGGCSGDVDRGDMRRAPDAEAALRAFLPVYFNA